MSCGVMDTLSRIKWWLFGPKTKFCKQCCLTCKYYHVCRADVEYVEMVMGEPWE